MTTFSVEFPIVSLFAQPQKRRNRESTVVLNISNMSSDQILVALEIHHEQFINNRHVLSCLEKSIEELPTMFVSSIVDT